MSLPQVCCDRQCRDCQAGYRIECCYLLVHQRNIFGREIERAQAAEAGLIVLVERPIKECLSFNYVDYISKKIKATPEFIFFNVREIIQKYPNVQFLFVNGREECVRVMKKIFFCNGEYKKYDLQLMYDLKLL